MEDQPYFGPCCCCGTTYRVRTIVMLNYRGTEAGKGWGCVLCGLPLDGVVYVACDNCVEFNIAPQEAVVGYVTDHRREAIARVYARGGHDHDLSKHPELLPTQKQR